MAMEAERDDDATSVNSGSGPKSGSRKKQSKRITVIEALDLRLSAQEERFTSLDTKLDSILSRISSSNDGVRSVRGNSDNDVYEGTYGEPPDASYHGRDDLLPVRLSPSERRGISIASNDSGSVQSDSISRKSADKEVLVSRFSKYVHTGKGNEQNDNYGLADIFSHDATTGRDKMEGGLKLDSCQTDILKES